MESEKKSKIAKNTVASVSSTAKRPPPAPPRPAPVAHERTPPKSTKADSVPSKTHINPQQTSVVSKTPVRPQYTDEPANSLRPATSTPGVVKPPNTKPASAIDSNTATKSSKSTPGVAKKLPTSTVVKAKPRSPSEVTAVRESVLARDPKINKAGKPPSGNGNAAPSTFPTRLKNVFSGKVLVSEKSVFGFKQLARFYRLRSDGSLLLFNDKKYSREKLVGCAVRAGNGPIVFACPTP